MSISISGLGFRTLKAQESSSGSVRMDKQARSHILIGNGENQVEYTLKELCVFCRAFDENL